MNKGSVVRLRFRITKKAVLADYVRVNVIECMSDTFKMLLFWSNGTFEVY